MSALFRWCCGGLDRQKAAATRTHWNTRAHPVMLWQLVLVATATIFYATSCYALGLDFLCKCFCMK